MAFTATGIDFKDTNSFSSLVNDYLNNDKSLAPFYAFSVDEAGIEKAIEQRKNYPIDRALLHRTIRKDYTGYTLGVRLQDNIDALLSEDCFTICTAHQPNIFTGHLYFIYKIIHAVKLAESLSKQHERIQFVPVYYMGSEDADIEELGELNIDGKQYQWATSQTGAVGRTRVDAALIKIIEEISRQISVLPFGKEIIFKLRHSYVLDRTVEDATFSFVHDLLGEYGVVILKPDSDELKKVFLSIAERELTEQFSTDAVSKTLDVFPKKYKVQTAGRSVNLFFLEADRRERIEEKGNDFLIGEGMKMDRQELLEKFEEHPSRISPNVILRPIFQEMILPNIVFIGGGGELAYWLELKEVFARANVFFPVLMLRNSFSLMSQKAAVVQERLSITNAELFLPAHEVVKNWILRNADRKILLTEEKAQVIAAYSNISSAATAQDQTLRKHTEALQTQALNKLNNLEKKIIRSAKRREADTANQIAKLNSFLFPGGILQERVDNIIFWYAAHGPSIIECIYEVSSDIKSSFTLIKEK